jgi:hypothetical protein
MSHFKIDNMLLCWCARCRSCWAVEALLWAALLLRVVSWSLLYACWTSSPHCWYWHLLAGGGTLLLTCKVADAYAVLKAVVACPWVDLQST